VAAGPAPRSYTTAVGQRDSVRLPDGTRVLLGPATTLTLERGYGAMRRLVTLDGDAYFEVPHDSTRPFVVRAGPATVHDLGTAFALRRVGPEGVAVAVTQGAVRLSAAEPGATQPPARPDPRVDARVGARGGAAGAPGAAARAADTGVVLRAGDRGTVAAAPGTRALTATRLPGSAARAADDTAWTSGRLVFRDAPFAEVAASLRRWYGIELRAADPALAERHLTATFRGEPLPDVLRVVGLALGARLDRRGDTVLVHPAR
jgi:transmembrane sensor